MGQHTHMLVEIKITDAQTENVMVAYTAFQYQFGIGRVMPMAALNVVTKSPYFKLFDLSVTERKNLEKIISLVKNKLSPLPLKIL